MGSEVHILITEDLSSDAGLAEREILKVLPSARFKRVETRGDFIAALDEFDPDLIVSDYQMPSFDGLTALKIALKKVPVTPFIIHTGSMNEDTAVACMKAGATDYVIKEHMKRLGPAVKNALENKKVKIEHIKAKNNLRESELKFRHLVQGSKDIISMYDLQGTVLYKSPGVKIILGYEPEEVVGKSVFMMVHPDDKAKAHEQLKSLVSLPPGETIRFEIRALHKNGSTRRLDATLTNMLDQPGVNAIVGNYRNITEEYRAELIQQAQYNIAGSFITATGMDELFESIRKELSNVVDTKNFIIAFYDEEKDQFRAPYELDEKTTLPDAWPAADSLTGMVAGQKKTLLLRKKDIQKLAEQQKITFRGERAEVWLGLPMIINNRVIGVLVFQSYDDPEAFLETDIHMLEILANEMSIYIQKKRNEEALVLAKEKAEESDRLKSAFLANVSHEIRTPMNSILGFLELLKEPRMDDLQKTGYIDIVNLSAQRLLATINDIVELSKLESGQSEVLMQDVDINELMEEQYSLFKPKADEKGLVLKLADRLHDEPLHVLSDKHKLASIMANLLNNAIKFTDHGHVELGNYVEGDELVFFVKDTGVGIPESKLQAIFERFVQADPEITRGHEGSGLGLSIARAYLKLLDGRIWVESEQGKGSTFYFAITARPAFVAKQAATGQKHPATCSLAGQTILIAEDDDLSYLFLETILEDYDLNMLRAETGEEVIKLLQEHPEASLILMDLKMPGMGGLAATHEIRKFNTNIPIIAQTAHALMGDKATAIEHGCNDYLSKPINRKELISLMHQYVIKEMA